MEARRPFGWDHVSITVAINLPSSNMPCLGLPFAAKEDLAQKTSLIGNWGED
jgi:hypothetical protein